MSDWIVRGLHERFVREESVKRAAEAMYAAGYRGEPFTITVLSRRRWWHRFGRNPDADH